jgi:ATP-dependent Clp protease ATP-binding subunit ClpA
MAPNAADMNTASLFDSDGNLDRDRLDTDAEALLERCTAWLIQLNRTVYLPIDLMVVLLERGNVRLHRALSLATHGVERVDDLEDRLRTLARRVDREPHQGVSLHRRHFSLGFLGLLQDAWAWANESGRSAMSEADLERVVRWRAELQESASVRWAIRQLSTPAPDRLFHVDERLRAEAFQTDAWNLMRTAGRTAARSGLPFLGTPHAIAAAIHDGSMVEQACLDAGVDPRTAREELLRIVGSRSNPVPDFSLTRRTLTPRLVRMLNSAVAAASSRSARIGEADLLQAFIEDGGTSLEALRALGVEPPLQEVLRRAVDHPTISPSASAFIPSINYGDAPEPPSAVESGDSASPTLDLIGRNLSLDAEAGLLPQVLGRDHEIQRVINVLLRSEQRNPLLTGEAGVGKTAIAAALARRIHEGRVPKRLAKMRVVEINGASLVGGTSYRGELESRIRSLLTEAEDNVILFIDEAHAVFAPRTNSGQPAEVPNHFKAALASGKIAVVAATTEAEFHRWIEQDPALRRRFERIEVPELDGGTSRTILQGLAQTYQDDYEVRISDDAISAAVELSMRFMPEQSLPDKAKKLLMDSAIAVACESVDDIISSDEVELTPTENSGEIPVRLNLNHRPNVNRLDVARQVASKTGIPLHRITSSFLDGLAGLEHRLSRAVPGQEPAACEVARRLVAGRLAGAGRARPQGVFLFAGPAGTGKSRLAETLAVELFGSDKNVIKLNMADFQEPISLSRLIGSPPGYVGYQDEDALVTPLRRRPSSIVLLRDFDIAHPRVQDRLIRLFEEGSISDTRGLKADASHAIFVLTINCDVSSTRASIGFGSGKTASALELRDFNPELDDRLRGHAVETIMFRGPDDPELARAIIGQRIEAFSSTLETDFGVQLVIPDSVMKTLHQRALAVRDIREIERIFHTLIIEPVSKQLLHGVERSSVVVPESTPAQPVRTR